MAIQIQIRRDTTSNWETTDPVLADGELGLDTDLNMLKVGNGVDSWTELSFMAGSGSEIVTPLPDFLTYVEDRDHLPNLNTNFGWNSNGLWFGPTSDGEGSGTSYPVFTDFTIGQNDAVTVEFNFEVNEECNDVGLCVYVDGDTPDWQWGTDSSRIAAQFDCEMPILVGLTEDYQGERSNISGPGTYHVRFTYNPIGGTPVQFEYFEGTTTETLVSSLTLNETLGTGRYRVGFAADNSNSRTYISDLSIMVNEDTPYVDTLQEGDSGTDQDFVAPMSILDSSSNPLITFEKSYTGTARIVAPQDDLALRSARDILLYAGDDGPGNVYIGWGDADMTPDSNNRVATIADIQDATTGDITFDGVQIIGAGTASGDGNEYGTIELVPHASRYEFDQYLIIDPTAPNHIHIRAGGTQDGSEAELIIGAEETNVKVIDFNGTVQISTSSENNTYSLSNASTGTSSQFTTPYEGEYLYSIIGEGWTVTNSEDVTVPLTGTSLIDNTTFQATVDTADFFVENLTYIFRYANGADGDLQWTFAPDGVVYGPNMGQIVFQSIGSINQQDLGINANNSNLLLNASQDVQISTDSGDIFLNPDGHVYISSSSSSFLDRVPSFGDLPYIRTAVPTSSVGTTGDVAGYIADDASHHYYCTGTYDGTTNIWKRVAWSVDTW